MMEFYRTAPDVRPIAGVEDVLHELWRRGLHVVLDTGFDRAIVDVVLSRIGWEGAPWLLATVASDEVEQGRPAPDLIHAAMRIAGVTDPAHVTKVGDTPADVQEGLSANCGLVLGVAYGTHTRDELLAAGAHAVIEEPRELTQLLLRQE
jgi:phosphonatase-like hydrolase